MITQAVILVGGQGTRLRPLTSRVPKPVIDVVDRPFLGHMLDWLAGHGITEAVLEAQNALTQHETPRRGEAA